MSRRAAPIVALLAAACALGPRPGPPPDAPTESALAAAPPPDVCKVSPAALRRLAGLEAGTTPYGEVLDRLGRPPGLADGERACWLARGGDRVALFANGRFDDQPVRSLALAETDAREAQGCGRTSAIPSPAAFESGLRPGMALAEVEAILGNLPIDASGSFGKECCGLEQVEVSGGEPVYAYGCTAILGRFQDGVLSSVLVSRYAPPAQGEEPR